MPESTIGFGADTLDSSNLRFVDVEGTRTRYYEAGSGEPLVLLHGGDFGQPSTLDAWSRNYPGLAQRFRVIGLDRLGHGYTDNPRRDQDYTHQGTMAHLLGFLDALQLEAAHFAGHSRGALPVLSLALNHPERMRTAILVDTSTVAPEDPRFPTRTFFYPDLAKRIPPGPPSTDSIRIGAEAFVFDPSTVSDDYVNRLLQSARLPKTQEAKDMMARIETTVLVPSLEDEREACLRRTDERGVPVPTLVIWAAQDASAPLPLGFALFERIAARTKRAELAVINRASHSVYRDQPHAFNRVVSSFCLD